MKKFILLLPVLLASCQTPESIEASKVQYCTNMGAPPSSKNYYNCRQRLEQESIAAEKQRQFEYDEQLQNTRDANICSAESSSYDPMHAGGSFSDCMQKLRYYRANPNAAPIQNQRLESNCITEKTIYGLQTVCK